MLNIKKLMTKLTKMVTNPIVVTPVDVSISSIAAGAVKNAYTDVTIPTGYDYLCCIPNYTSEGLIVASVYTSAGAPAGKIRINATIYNRTASQKNDTARVIAVFRRNGGNI